MTNNINNRNGHEKYNIGDLIIYHSVYPTDASETCIYYITAKTRWGNRGQYRFDLTILKEPHNSVIGKTYSYNTGRLNDRIQYWDWKHIPVNNGSSLQKTKKV